MNLDGVETIKYENSLLVLIHRLILTYRLFLTIWTRNYALSY